MTKVLAGITTSVDGFVAGPDDGPGKGLGEGGERLHYWVFGKPWTYDSGPEGEPTGGNFSFVNGVEEAVERAKEAAGDKDVHVMGGADIIRQSLEADLVDELSIIVAPFVLGGGKHLFEGFKKEIELEHMGVRQSPFATFIDYRVKRS